MRSTLPVHLAKYFGCSPAAHGSYASANAARNWVGGWVSNQNSNQGCGVGSSSDALSDSWKLRRPVACGSATMPCTASCPYTSALCSIDRLTPLVNGCAMVASVESTSTSIASAPQSCCDGI